MSRKRSESLPLFYAEQTVMKKWIMCGGFRTRMENINLENETLSRKGGGGISFQMSEGVLCKEWYDFLPTLRVESHRHREQISDYIQDDHLNKLCHLKIKWVYLWNGKFFMLFKQRLSDRLPDTLLGSLVAENFALC